MSIGAVFYFISALILLAVGLGLANVSFDVWMVAAGFALLGVMFSGIPIPNFPVMVRKE